MNSCAYRSHRLYPRRRLLRSSRPGTALPTVTAVPAGIGALPLHLLIAKGAVGVLSILFLGALIFALLPQYSHLSRAAMAAGDTGGKAMLTTSHHQQMATISRAARCHLQRPIPVPPPARSGGMPSPVTPPSPARSLLVDARQRPAMTSSAASTLPVDDSRMTAQPALPAVVMGESSRLVRFYRLQPRFGAANGY